LSAVRKKDTADIIKSTTSNILHLKEKYAHAAKSAEDISRRSGEISQCIQEIVVVIQFHDIMRQRFEHARAAFGSMAEILEAVSGREDLSGIADDLLMFCVHEGAPLYRTREDFVSAVLSVIDNLKILSSSVNSLLEEVKSLVHAGSSMEGSFLDTIDRSLSEVNSTVNAFYAGGMTKGELSAATSVVVDTLAEISRFIRAIEYIGDEIELIAFNAAVKADQIGDEGRALGVVADEIQSISAVAQVHTSSIAGILKNVGSYAEELSMEVGEGERAYMLKIEETSRKLSGFTGFLTDLNKELISLISSIEETGKGLVDEIDGIIGSISIHEDVELVIEAVISNLREIFSETTGMFPAVSGTSRADISKSFDQLLNAEVKRLKSERKTGAAATAPQEFGENVELFS
jgi:methyl-accepting chemotaxis protein